MINIDVYSDLSCPWCYVGKRRLDKAIQQFNTTSVSVSWHPYIIDRKTASNGEEYMAYNMRRCKCNMTYVTYFYCFHSCDSVTFRREGPTIRPSSNQSVLFLQQVKQHKNCQLSWNVIMIVLWSLKVTPSYQWGDVNLLPFEQLGRGAANTKDRSPTNRDSSDLKGFCYCESIHHHSKSITLASFGRWVTCFCWTFKYYLSFFLFRRGMRAFWTSSSGGEVMVGLIH